MALNHFSWEHKSPKISWGYSTGDEVEGGEPVACGGSVQEETSDFRSRLTHPQGFRWVLRWPDRAGEGSVMRPKAARTQIALFLHPSGMVNGTGLSSGGVLRWTVSGVSTLSCAFWYQSLHKPGLSSHYLSDLRLYYILVTILYSSCTLLKLASNPAGRIYIPVLQMRKLSTDR